MGGKEVLYLGFSPQLKPSSLLVANEQFLFLSVSIILLSWILIYCVLPTVRTFFTVHMVFSVLPLEASQLSNECILAFWHKKFLTIFFSIPDVPPLLYLSFSYFKIFKPYYYFMCIVFCLYVCLCTVCALGGQKKPPRTVMNCYVGARN